MGINLKYNSNYLWRIIFTIMIVLLHSNYTRIDQAYTGWYLAVDSGRLKKKLVNDIIQCIYDMNYIQ